MSQIVDYGDPYMEMLSIFLRLLEKVIADSSWAAMTRAVLSITHLGCRSTPDLASIRSVQPVLVRERAAWG